MMSFLGRNRRAKTLLLAVLLISAGLLFGSTSSHKNIKFPSLKVTNPANPFADADEDPNSPDELSPAEMKQQLGGGILPTSSPEDSENLKNLYLDSTHKGAISGGSTGNLPGDKKPEDEVPAPGAVDHKVKGDGSSTGPAHEDTNDDAHKAPASGDDNDERTIPLTPHQSPSEEALNKIKPEDVIKEWF
ncbi:unnamed protein product [Ambrosiozyma monospora]|uniref:Unnamed protein product n=1 Tax=Ambrosiozyma monospora TaxID=43982 RepID=A0ACB5UBU3_AMBMO|nr:unnamed protein product [Ambrosiozyma monospora]